MDTNKVLHVKNIRKRMHMTQTVFASRLGARADELRAWSCGTKIPTPQTLSNIFELTKQFCILDKSDEIREFENYILMRLRLDVLVIVRSYAIRNYLDEKADASRKEIWTEEFPRCGWSQNLLNHFQMETGYLLCPFKPFPKEHDPVFSPLENSGYISVFIGLDQFECGVHLTDRGERLLCGELTEQSVFDPTVAESGYFISLRQAYPYGVALNTIQALPLSMQARILKLRMSGMGWLEIEALSPTFDEWKEAEELDYEFAESIPEHKLTVPMLRGWHEILMGQLMRTDLAKIAREAAFQSVPNSLHRGSLESFVDLLPLQRISRSDTVLSRCVSSSLKLVAESANSESTALAHMGVA